MSRGESFVAARDVALRPLAPRCAPLLVVGDLVAELLELPGRDVVRQDPPGEAAVHRLQPVVHEAPSASLLACGHCLPGGQPPLGLMLGNRMVMRAPVRIAMAENPSLSAFAGASRGDTCVVAHKLRSPAATSPSSIVPPRYRARICGLARISAPVPSSLTRPVSMTTP